MSIFHSVVLESRVQHLIKCHNLENTLSASTQVTPLPSTRYVQQRESGVHVTHLHPMVEHLNYSLRERVNRLEQDAHLRRLLVPLHLSLEKLDCLFRTNCDAYEAL